MQWASKYQVFGQNPDIEDAISKLTGAIFETGAYGVPSKSPKSFICGGVRQT